MIPRSVRIAALATGLLAITAAHAAEVAGIKMDDQIKVGTSELVLNGAGVRTKVFFKVYVGALYVSQKSNAPAALLEPRRRAG